MKDKMKIAEIFESIQGEGILTGVPSFFIRTAGCNLACSWCDTPYALDPAQSKEISIDEIVQAAQKSAPSHAVITGGEPLIQKKTWELAARLRDVGLHITLETNGLIAPNNICCDLASISPKLSNSHSGAERAFPFDILDGWLENYPFQLKFVIGSERDIADARSFIQQIGAPIEPHDILLMPLGTSVDEMNAVTPLILCACRQFGYRYCRRLQIDLFGNKRGT